MREGGGLTADGGVPDLTPPVEPAPAIVPDEQPPAEEPAPPPPKKKKKGS